MSENFSSSLKLIDLDDYVSPGLECIKPVKINKDDNSSMKEIQIDLNGNFFQLNSDGSKDKLEKTKIELSDCFSKGTLVIMSDGSLKKIENIEEGDKVLGPDSKPRKVLSITNGKDVMYRITQKTHHKDDLSYGKVEFVCNSTHLLVVETPKFIGAVKQARDSSGFVKELINFYELSNVQIHDKKVAMVIKREKSFSHNKYGETRAKEKAEEFRTSLLEKRSKEKTIKWLIKAEDVKYIQSEVRAATFQNWSPILIENGNFRSKCEKFGIKEENIHKIAWLFGLWMGDGYSKDSCISVNINDKDEIERIQEYSKDLGLIASIEPHQTPNQKNTFSGTIDINSSQEWITSFGETSKYQHKKKFNVFWDLILSYGLGLDNYKSIPTDFHLEEIFVREWFLSGLIDSDGHLNIEQNRVNITTIYENVRDGIIKISKSLGIRVSVSTRSNYIDKLNVTRQNAYFIELSMCSALQNILSKCSITGKFTSIGGSNKKKMEAPKKVEYLQQPFYFHCEKIQTVIIEEKKQKLDLKKLPDDKIRELMKKNKNFGYSLRDMSKLSEELEKVHSTTIGQYLNGSTKISEKSTIVCIKILRDNYDKIKDDLSSKRKFVDDIQEYFGFTLSNESDHLFLLDNNSICHNCLACSGCVTSAESILVNQQSTSEFLKSIDSNQTFIVSISPQSISSIGAYFNLDTQQTYEKLTTFFKSLGAKYVFDTSFSRDFSLLEMCYEFIDHYKSKTLPILSSACPGFICYAEKTTPEILPSISKVKSPQQIMGTLVKRYFASKLNLKSSDIYHVSIMPCYDKKLEASREDFIVNDKNEVDCVLTTSEIFTLLEEKNLKFPELNNTKIDTIFNNISNEGKLLGVSGGSGGYLETIFRFASKELFNTDVGDITYRVGRNKDYKETSLIVNDEKVLTFCQAYGFRNIQNIVKKLKRKVQFDFCEIMACPSGCVNGGGQIKNPNSVKPKDHLQNVENLYETVLYQNPFYNKNAELIYKEFVKDQIYSLTSKELFHTQYHKREKININPLQIKW